MSDGLLLLFIHCGVLKWEIYKIKSMADFPTASDFEHRMLRKRVLFYEVTIHTLI